MFLRNYLEKLGQRFKGPEYRLDPKLPLSALVGLALRRSWALGRCLGTGVVFSLNPRDLIFVGKGVALRNRRFIHFGRGVTLGNYVTIDGLSVQGVTLGDKVNIGPYSIIEATGILSNLGVGCTVGENSAMGAFSFVGAAGGVWIGRNVIMGQRVSFHAENHVFTDLDRPIREQGITRQGIHIEDDCWIGANVTFLDGAYVEHGCVIAAGAVVRGRIPAYAVAGGVPAKVLKSRRPESNL